MKAIGILLIVIGAIGVVWGGFSYVKDRDTAHLGPINLVVESKDRVSIPPVVGLAALVAGGLLVVMSSRKGGRLIT